MVNNRLGNRGRGLLMRQQRQLLLLVDGDVVRAERLAKRLSHLDFDIRIADDGATGLLAAHEMLPDVVIAAAEMSILDGYRMLEALRDKPQTSHIPVILITEDNTHEELARCWQAGADLCVPRTQGEADVLATLHRALSSVRAREGSPHELSMVS
jgi:CheY-like chemotaxis protein